jgi:hypothetical protein
VPYCKHRACCKHTALHSGAAHAGLHTDVYALPLLILWCDALQQQHSHDHGICSGHHHAEHTHTTAATAAAAADSDYSTQQYHAHTRCSSSSSAAAAAAAADEQQFQQDELQVDEETEVQEHELDELDESDAALAVRLGMTAGADLGNFNLKVVSHIAQKLQKVELTKLQLCCVFSNSVLRRW